MKIGKRGEQHNWDYTWYFFGSTHCFSAMAEQNQRFYDEVELKRRGSRERLLDHYSHTHMYANKLHR